MVRQAGLKDLGFKGSKFTWPYNCKRTSYVAARLDRVLVKSHWILSAKELHSPILQCFIWQDSLLTIVPSFSFIEALCLTIKLLSNWKNCDCTNWKNCQDSPCQGNPQFVSANKLKLLKQPLSLGIGRSLETLDEILAADLKVQSR